MAAINSTQIPTAEDFDVLQNRIAVALAKREQLIKSWTASSSRPRPPRKTQEEIDAEDAELFNPTPPGLGLGAPIPKEFLDGDVKRSELAGNDKLRRLLLGRNTGFNASKPRDAQEKTGSGRRGLKDESSEEEEGRSALGKAKKLTSGNNSTLYEKPLDPKFASDMKPKINSIVKRNKTSGNIGLFKPVTQVQRGSTLKEDASQQMLSSQALRKSSITPRKALVDYSSNEDSDESNKTPLPTFTEKPSAEASRLSVTIVPQPKYEVPQNSMEPPAKPCHKSSLSHGSKRPSRGSSSDSEPSDMETAIPLALTSDVIAPATLPTTESNLAAAAAAKRAKKRQKRARQKEKEKQKVLAGPVMNDGLQKSEVVTQGKYVVAKKIKDRLLDANGN